MRIPGKSNPEMEVQVKRAFKSNYISRYVGKKKNTKADRICMNFF